MTALLVTADASIGGPIADALERTGVDVMWCRGPAGHDCVCAAIRGPRCALTADVDVVVVDSWLTSDKLERGYRSWQLIRYYESFGLPVVALMGSRDTAPSLTSGRRTITMSRRSDPAEIAAGARRAAALHATQIADETA